jgi:hypothetical protein
LGRRSLCVPYRVYVTTSRYDYESSLEKCLVILSRFVVTEAREQFRNPEEVKLQPLETVTRRVMKTVDENNSMF